MAEAIAIPTVQGFWAGVGERLKNWGSKIKGFAFRAGSYIKRAASWLWHTTATQWVVSKVGWLASKAWHYAKGPIGWVAAPIAAIIFAPKAVAVMLFLVLLAVAAIGVLVWATYRHMKKVSTPEQFEEMKEEVTLIREAISEEVRIASEQARLNMAHDGLSAARDGIDKARQNLVDSSLQLTDDAELNPNETYIERIQMLDKLLSTALDEEDAGMVSELTGRMHLLIVRSGKGGKDKKDSLVTKVYRSSKEEARRSKPDFPWNWIRMSNAVKNEDKRLKDIAQLKAKRANLTSV